MFLLIDKPKGITSHDVIYKLRKVSGEKRIGHAGTLDPNATGLLIIGIGREFTKKLGFLTTGTTKTYEAQITLGATSSTEDSEGIITTNKVRALPSEEEIKKTLKGFEGEQLQIPSIFSAIKLNGKKAYQLARDGKKVNLEARNVVIHSIKLVDYNYPILLIECTVSSGTYIRALARDIGEKLGVGAYLSNLRRIAVGEFGIEDAVRLEDVTSNEFINSHSFGDYPGDH